MRNIFVKLFWISSSGSGGDIVYRYFLSLAAPLFGGVELFVQFKAEGIMSNMSVELILIWTSGLGGEVG